jgi:hypothetical protein
MRLLRTLLVFVLLMFGLLVGTVLAAQPVIFTADSSEGPMPQADRDWLLQSYFPARWEAERQIISWLNDAPAPDGEGLIVNVHLHPGLFESPTGAGIVGGQMLYPAFGISYDIHVDWDYEMNRGGIVLSHEFGHLLQFVAGKAGWEFMGHGVPEDPILKKLLAIGELVYMPGHVYDPFKPSVY